MFEILLSMSKDRPGLFIILVGVLFIVVACNPFFNDEENITNEGAVKDLTYSRLDGMSGDIFRFSLVTNSSLNKFYQENKYKYSHFKCNDLEKYIITGAISIDEEKVNSGKYTSPGYFKVCEDESMNVCINKNQVEKVLANDMSCRVVFGGLLQSSKVVVDNILISKEVIRKSNFK